MLIIQKPTAQPSLRFLQSSLDEGFSSKSVSNRSGYSVCVNPGNLCTVLYDRTGRTLSEPALTRRLVYVARSASGRLPSRRNPSVSIHSSCSACTPRSSFYNVYKLYYRRFPSNSHTHRQRNSCSDVWNTCQNETQNLPRDKPRVASRLESVETRSASLRVTEWNDRHIVTRSTPKRIHSTEGRRFLEYQARDDGNSPDVNVRYRKHRRERACRTMMDL